MYIAGGGLIVFVCVRVCALTSRGRVMPRAASVVDGWTRRTLGASCYCCSDAAAAPPPPPLLLFLVLLLLLLLLPPLLLLRLRQRLLTTPAGASGQLHVAAVEPPKE